MKAIPTILLSSLLVTGCLADPKPADHATTFLPGSLPAGWVMTCSTNSEQFNPLRGLNNPIAQLTLVNRTVVLARELAPGKTKTFHPNIVLLVFPLTDLNVVEEAVRKEGARSDYPPIIFGLTDQHVLVTSPGYINNGLHTPEADAVIKELKDSLDASIEIR